ncbi:MAG: flagellar basal-body MS-ring/collar protein FliF [bacterium]
MEAISKMLAEAARFWRRLGVNQKVTLGVSLVAIVALSAGILAWSGRPDYVLLFSNLSAEDAWSVVESLNKEAVPYKFSQNGSAIHVPEKDVYRLRISLAASGLPKSSELGFEIFDGTATFGLSDFVQQVNYQRALEGELARTISGITDVEHARVHVTMPKESLFAEEVKTTASVVIALRDGASLDEREVAGITHLVASSVPRLSAENVTVVDARGRILTNPADEEMTVGLSKGELDTQRRLEDYISKKVQSLLEGVLGAGKAIVKVNAELDFRRIEETRESYDPENVVVRSEERVEESGDQSGPQNAERSVTNYEVNRSVQRILGTAGTVRRLSVAVFVDGKMITPAGGAAGAEPVYQERSQQEIDKLITLVKTTVGFDAARGDQVEVATLPFEHDGAGAFAGGSEGAPAAAAITGTAMGILTKATPFIILVAILLFLKKSMTSVAQAFAEKKEEIEETLLPERAMDEVEARKIEIRSRVETLAVERPSEVATLIRNWMMED